jgi:hypothetical protein
MPHDAIGNAPVFRVEVVKRRLAVLALEHLDGAPAGRATWQPVQVARLVKVIRRNEARALRTIRDRSL